MNSSPTPEPALPQRSRELTRQAVELAVAMMERAAQDGATELPAAEVKIGLPVELPAHVDPATEGVLHPFGTSGSEVAATYLLVHSLPLACRAVRVPDGAAGAGGWRVELDRPVSAYVASGALREFTVTD